jgi:hypothetical protein
MAAAVLLATWPVAAQTGETVPPAEAQGQGTRTPRSPAVPPTPTPGCVVTATHKADPAVIRNGEVTTATVHLSTRCVARFIQTQVLLVLDVSPDLDPKDRESMVSSARKLITDLLAGNPPGLAIGLVGFRPSSRISCPVTPNQEKALLCLKRIEKLRDDGRPGPHTLERAIPEARQLLRRARGGEDDHRQVLVIYTRGPAGGNCFQALRAASQAREEHILVMAVCVGPDCEEDCVRRLASSPRYFFRVEEYLFLDGAFRRILEEVLNGAPQAVPQDTIRTYLRWLDFHYRPAAEIYYIPDSAIPRPDATPEPCGRLGWRQRYVPNDGVTITLRLIPVATGRLSLAAEAGAEWLDTIGHSGSLVVPTAEVEVLP